MNDYLQNISSTLANNVRLEIFLLRTETAVLMFDEGNYPARPQRKIPVITSRFSRNATKVEITKYYWKLSANFGNIQPKASNQSDVFYIGTTKPCDLKLDANVYADNLPDPLLLSLNLKINTQIQKLDTTKLSNLD